MECGVICDYDDLYGRQNPHFNPLTYNSECPVELYVQYKVCYV